MGIFLNSAAPYSLYESEVKKPYFVDKNFDYPEKPLKYKHIRRISD